MYGSAWKKNVYYYITQWIVPHPSLVNQLILLPCAAKRFQDMACLSSVTLVFRK